VHGEGIGPHEPAFDPTSLRKGELSVPLFSPFDVAPGYI
jgi:hypothetical protein